MNFIPIDLWLFDNKIYSFKQHGSTPEMKKLPKNLN